jgi:hypothetical protein
VSEHDQAVAELYGLPPGEFVAARNAKVRELRASGRREIAAAVGRLRRPSLNEWALNMAARTHPDVVAAWVEAVADVRAVQEAAAAGQRVDPRGSFAVLRERAQQLRTVAGQWSTRDDLAMVLNDIAASADAISALRAGVLGADPGVFGDAVPMFGSVATGAHAGSARALRPAPQRREDGATEPPHDDAAAMRAAKDELDDARAAAVTAARVNDEARAAVEAAERDVDTARRRLDEAEAAQSDAKAKLRDTARFRAAAERRLRAAEQRHDAAVRRHGSH